MTLGHIRHPISGCTGLKVPRKVSSVWLVCDRKWDLQQGVRRAPSQHPYLRHRLLPRPSINGGAARFIINTQRAGSNYTRPASHRRTHTELVTHFRCVKSVFSADRAIAKWRSFLQLMVIYLFSQEASPHSVVLAAIAINGSGLSNFEYWNGVWFYFSCNLPVQIYIWITFRCIE